MGGENESLAPKAVIDWLNGRAPGFTTADGDDEVRADWSTGKVGMTGTSYNGTLPLAAATTGVEGLEAIIPVAPNTSYYHYYRSNGLVRSPGGYPGEDIDVLFDFIFSGDPATRPHCIESVRDEMTARLDRATGDYNDFWAGRDYLNHVDGVRAATLMSHGFNDWNVMPEHSHRITEALKERGVPVQIYYHQGGHGGPPPLRLMNRWFTRYLLGVENGVEDDPGAWIVRAGDGPADPTPYPTYPAPRGRGREAAPRRRRQRDRHARPGRGRRRDRPGPRRGDRRLRLQRTPACGGRGFGPPPSVRLTRAGPRPSPLRCGNRPPAAVGKPPGGESVGVAGRAAVDRRRPRERQPHHPGMGRSRQPRAPRTSPVRARGGRSSPASGSIWSSHSSRTTRSFRQGPGSAS